MTLTDKIRFVTIPLILIPEVFIAYFPGKIVIVTSLCLYPLLFFYLYQFIKRSNNREVEEGQRSVNFYLVYCLFIMGYAAFTLTSRQDYIVYFSSSIFIFLLFPIILKSLTLRSFSIFMKSFIIIGAIVALLVSYQEGQSHRVARGFILLIFMIPYLNRFKSVFILLFISYLTINDLGSRSLLISVIFACFVLLCYYVISNKRYLIKLYKTIAISCFVTPLILLALGLTGIFNIFTISDYVKTDIEVGDNKKGDRSLLVDSRTSIYMDVFGELHEKQAYIWGLGANGKTKTSLTDNINIDYTEIYKEGRRGTESGMLNHIQYGGLFGLIAYYLLMFSAACLAIWRSNNFFAVFLGMWCSFKLLYSFIEDFTTTGSIYLFLLLAVGICYNKRFREMNNKQMKQYIKSFF